MAALYTGACGLDNTVNARHQLTARNHPEIPSAQTKSRKPLANGIHADSDAAACRTALASTNAR